MVSGYRVLARWGLRVALFLVVCDILSLTGSMAWLSSRQMYAVGVRQQKIAGWFRTKAPPPSLSPLDPRECLGHGFPEPWWRPYWGVARWGSYHGAEVYLRIPIWMLLALILPPTVLFYWLDRRRIRPGCCRACGYDLTGNVSGRCPECGTPCAGAVKTEDRVRAD